MKILKSPPTPSQGSRNHYHSCNYRRIPFVHSELASAQILLNSNYSFVRFGDLDLDLIQGKSWPNQNASPELSQHLHNVLCSNDSRLLIGIYDIFSSPSRTSYAHQKWMDDNQQYMNFLLNTIDLEREYLSTIVTSPYILNLNTSCVPISKIYNTLRKIWLDKDVVILRGRNGQEYQYDVFDTAKSQTIVYARPYQAWSDYHLLKKTLLEQPKERLYLLSAGPVAKVLTYDLTISGRRALDLGHLAKDYNLYMLREGYSGNFFID